MYSTTAAPSTTAELWCTISRCGDQALVFTGEYFFDNQRKKSAVLRNPISGARYVAPMDEINFV